MNLPDPLPESQDLRFRMLYHVINRLIAYCKSITPQIGTGCNLHRSSAGFNYSVAATSPGSPVFQAQVMAEYDDYLVCTLASTNGLTTVAIDDSGYVVNGPAGHPITPGATIRVAKPFLLRRISYDGLTLPDPDNALATYVAQDQRTAGDDNQQIYPSYTVGAVIDVAIPNGGTGVMTDPEEEGNNTGAPAPVTYLDQNNDDRTWATEVPACDANGNPGFRLVPCSQWYENSINPD
jgi:hypothetical protein